MCRRILVVCGGEESKNSECIPSIVKGHMRKININNPEELKKFKMETSGFISSYGFPYKLDDLTEKGANYTVFCPLRWKSAFSPAKLHKLLREDVDADKIRVEYIDFVKDDVEDKSDKIWNVDYF